MELEFAGGLFGTSSLDGLEIVTRVNWHWRQHLQEQLPKRLRVLMLANSPWAEHLYIVMYA